MIHYCALNSVSNGFGELWCGLILENERVELIKNSDLSLLSLVVFLGEQGIWSAVSMSMNYLTVLVCFYRISHNSCIIDLTNPHSCGECVHHSCLFFFRKIWSSSAVTKWMSKLWNTHEMLKWWTTKFNNLWETLGLESYPCMHAWISLSSHPSFLSPFLYY